MKEFVLEEFSSDLGHSSAVRVHLLFHLAIQQLSLYGRPLPAPSIGGLPFGRWVLSPMHL